MSSGEMVAFTFVLKSKKGAWSATRTSAEEPELTAEAGSSAELQKALLQLAVENAPAGGISTAYSPISPTSAVYQVKLSVASVLSECTI